MRQNMIAKPIIKLAACFLTASLLLFTAISKSSETVDIASAKPGTGIMTVTRYALPRGEVTKEFKVLIPTTVMPGYIKANRDYTRIVISGIEFLTDRDVHLFIDSQSHNSFELIPPPGHSIYDASVNSSPLVLVGRFQNVGSGEMSDTAFSLFNIVQFQLGSKVRSTVVGDFTKFTEFPYLRKLQNLKKSLERPQDTISDFSSWASLIPKVGVAPNRRHGHVGNGHNQFVIDRNSYDFKTPIETPRWMDFDYIRFNDKSRVLFNLPESGGYMPRIRGDYTLFEPWPYFGGQEDPNGSQKPVLVYSESGRQMLQLPTGRIVTIE